MVRCAARHTSREDFLARRRPSLDDFHNGDASSEDQRIRGSLFEPEARAEFGERPCWRPRAMVSEIAATASRSALRGSVSAPTNPSEAAAALWLLCRAGLHHYAFPLEDVIEIMRPRALEAIAGAPPYVRGLCVIRGVPTPVVDAGLLFGERSARTERLVTIRADGRAIAFAADAVLGVRTIRADACAQPPPLLREAAGDKIAAIGTLDAGLLFFLRAVRLVPEDFLAHLRTDGTVS
jgi:purine-binding chemotaxis protein CheW